MQKSLLSLYIQKVGAGDASFAPRLCGQLADRLVFIPTVEQSKNGRAVSVSVVRIVENGVAYTPMFTTEKKLRDWAALTGRGSDAVSLLGADFCTALSPDTHLWVDIGGEPNVRLKPEHVRQIASSEGAGALPEPAIEPVRSSPPPAASAVTSLASFPGAAPFTLNEPAPTESGADEELSDGEQPMIVVSAPAAPSSMSGFPTMKNFGAPDSAPSAPPLGGPSSVRPPEPPQKKEPPPPAPVDSPPPPPAPAHDAPWSGRSSLAGGALRGEPVSTAAAEFGVAPEVEEVKKKGLFGLFKKG